MENKHFAVLISTIAIAAVVALITIAASSGEAKVAGERFHDPKYKITMDLPVGWKEAAPSAELQEAYAGREQELVAHFTGPEGGSLNVLVFPSDLKLYAIRRGLLEQENIPKVRVIQDTFPTRINGTPAWLNQFIVQEQVMPVYNVRVILDRGSTKVMMQYTLTPGSMQRQRKSIHHSVQSIRLD